tara:strand:- start:2880 stop:3101 length:222 start_codon:yes stop_codon:yes gene_type:complete
MKQTRQGIRHFLEEITKFFISMERMLEDLESKNRQITMLNDRVESLIKDLEIANNELLIITDRARREAGINIK